MIPLRPLAVGEILGAAVQVVRRHFVPLAAVSLVLSVVSGLASWGILQATGETDLYLSGAWLDGLVNGTTAGVPSGIIGALLLDLVISLAAGVATAGLATVCAAQDTLGRPTTGHDWRERLGGRWVPLLTISLLVGVLVSVGLALFVIPGVLIYLAWLVAAPALVLERGTIGVSLRRSAELTRGERGRLLGLVAAVLVVTVVLTTFVSSLLGQAFNGLTPSGAYLVAEGIGALVTMFTGSWAGAVSALAYIDLRIRKENLAPTLAAAARAVPGAA